MSLIKTPQDIALLREGGKHHSAVLEEVVTHTLPGVSTKELNDIALAAIKRFGDTASFLGYTPRGAPFPFPAALCVSVNDVIVHGMPERPNLILKEGDIVGLDLGVTHEGLITDSAVTVAVGEVDDVAEELMTVTKQALLRGIAAARAGNTTGDIGYAIMSYVRPFGYGIVRELGGHGVGHKVHEEPMILNFGTPGSGVRLEAGMVIAIEPMLNEGSAKVVFEDDGYTIRTKDRKRSAHFEHTLVITDGEPEILTA